MYRLFSALFVFSLVALMPACHTGQKQPDPSTMDPAQR